MKHDEYRVIVVREGVKDKVPVNVVIGSFDTELRALWYMSVLRERISNDPNAERTNGQHAGVDHTIFDDARIIMEGVSVSRVVEVIADFGIPKMELS